MSSTNQGPPTVADPFNTAGGAVSGGPDLTLVNGRTFTVARSSGSVSEPTDGTMFEDLRIVSRFEFAIVDPDAPHPRRHLSTTCPSPFHAVSVFQPDLRVPAAQCEPTEHYVHRQWVGRGVRHDLEIHNAAATAIRRTLELRIGVDFAHLFDVKSGHADVNDRPIEISGDGLCIASADATDTVRVVMSPTPTTVDLDDGVLCWELSCGPRASTKVTITFEPHWDGEPAGLTFPAESTPRPFHETASHSERASIVTTDARLARAFDRALVDLASLRIFDPSHPERVVIAAGAPWFMTLFGRDSLLTSWMALPFEPDLAIGVLASLAELQGSHDDPATEEQPGKILHELRRHSGQNPFGARGRYYGTVDATPLFVMLAAEARRWGHLGDDHLRLLAPHIEAATAWILDRIASSPSGFVSYQRSTEQGLLNQGWKDSGDGISHADGRMPDGPIALAEVQGYAYAALMGAVELADGFADLCLDVDDLTAKATRLREQFNARFWIGDDALLAVGIAGTGETIDTLTTNPGHALWSGIADEEPARRYIERCMAELWTGWGLRTLAPSAGAYNPVSYHNGSVWPHDTAIVAAGARRYGCIDAARTIIDGALDAADHFDGRPPELFAGIDRADIPAPVTYPGSCSPQAWASASTLLNLRTGLDLAPASDPADPPETGASLFADRVVVAGVRIGPLVHVVEVS